MVKKILSMFISNSDGVVQLRVGKTPKSVGLYVNVIGELTISSIIIEKDENLCTVSYEETEELTTSISLEGLNYNYMSTSWSSNKFNDINDVYDYVNSLKKEDSENEGIITK